MKDNSPFTEIGLLSEKYKDFKHGLYKNKEGDMIYIHKKGYNFDKDHPEGWVEVDVINVSKETSKLIKIDKVIEGIKEGRLIKQ